MSLPQCPEAISAILQVIQRTEHQHRLRDGVLDLEITSITHHRSHAGDARGDGDLLRDGVDEDHVMTVFDQPPGVCAGSTADVQDDRRTLQARPHDGLHTQQLYSPSS